METDEIGTVAERVDRGISVLPENWREKITRPVNIAHVRDCILGQVLGNYWDALDRLWPHPSFTDEQQGEMAVKHGFNIQLDEYCLDLGPDCCEAHNELNAEWQRRVDS